MALAAYNDYIYTSIDSGNTWTQHVELGKHRFISIAGSANNSVLVAGTNFDYLYISRDYGNTWTNTTVNPVTPGKYGNYQSVAVSADGSIVYAIDSGSTGLHKSSDGGQTWTQFNVSYPSSSQIWWNYPEFIVTSANGSFIAVTNTEVPTPYFSNDGGVTWYTTNSTFLFPGLRIAASADGRHLALVTALITGGNYGNGTIYASQDGGVTWTYSNTLPFAQYVPIAISSDASLYVTAIFYPDYSYTTYKGSIYTSSNQGATWTEQNAGYKQWIGISSSSNGSVLLAGALKDYMYVSVNSGVNWTKSF